MKELSCLVLLMGILSASDGLACRLVCMDDNDFHRSVHLMYDSEDEKTFQVIVQGDTILTDLRCHSDQTVKSGERRRLVNTCWASGDDYDEKPLLTTRLVQEVTAVASPRGIREKRTTTKLLLRVYDPEQGRYIEHAFDQTKEECGSAEEG